jgi:hypothetical protein
MAVSGHWEAVAPLDTAGLEAVSQPVGQTLQVRKSIAFDLAGFIFVDQGQAIGVSGPFVADIHPEVVIRRDIPLEGIKHVVIGLAGSKHSYLPFFFPANVIR